MDLSTRFHLLYEQAKGNKWYHYFAVFCRVMLAIGFIPSGIMKVMGERFASGLSVNHPLGHYLDALHQTGYYYTFIGIVQLVIALLLIIPRTALLGALMYFPIILNICVLTYATRFEGTRITTLMVIANLFLLCWDFKRIKHVLPFRRTNENGTIIKTLSGNKFPVLFFAGVVVMITSVIAINHFMYNIRPGNILIECTNGCAGNKDPKACLKFCDCIHNQGKQLNDCLNKYNAASMK